jgi:hypothetical protein
MQKKVQGGKKGERKKGTGSICPFQSQKAVHTTFLFLPAIKLKLPLLAD